MRKPGVRKLMTQVKILPDNGQLDGDFAREQMRTTCAVLVVRKEVVRLQREVRHEQK